jgi:hypothetical protein
MTLGTIVNSFSLPFSSAPIPAKETLCTQRSRDNKYRVYFFASRASAANPTMKPRKRLFFNDDSYQRLKSILLFVIKNAPSPLLMKVHFEWVLLCELKTPIFTLSHWGL